MTLGTTTGHYLSWIPKGLTEELPQAQSRLKTFYSPNHMFLKVPLWVRIQSLRGVGHKTIVGTYLIKELTRLSARHYQTKELLKRMPEMGFSVSLGILRWPIKRGIHILVAPKR